MTEDADKSNTPEPDGMDSLLGGFDLTPDWARGTPGIQSQPRDDGGSRRGPKAPGQSARRGLQGVRVKPRRDQYDGQQGGGSRHQGGSGGDGFSGHHGNHGGGERRGYAPRLPVHVDFIPEKQRLSKVVKVVRQSHRVFPMDQIAGKFMENPAFLSIKFTVKESPKGKSGGKDGGEGADDVASGAEASLTLYQCKANGMVFSDRNACVQYILDRGLGEYYDETTREVAPPAGNFVCVGRHRSSGKLIGPPNWHGYQRQLESLRVELAPDLSPEAFANQIETVREEEVIAAWKKEAAVQTFYRRKPEDKPSKKPRANAAAKKEVSEKDTAPEVAEPEAVDAEGASAASAGENPEVVPEETAEAPAGSEGDAGADTESQAEASEEETAEDETAEPEAEASTGEEAPFDLTREQAEKEFLENVVPTLISQTRRAIMPGYLLPKMTDPALASMAEFHLRREHNRPGSIVFALRPAFKHMRLHLFRHEGELMVSGISPHPLPEAQKIAPELQRILDYVAANPGCNAKVALEALAADTTESTPALVSHVHWLIEKGHLLEFSDGALFLPQAKGKH
ncbi:MAG: hypothetical protein JJU29_15150 [Verrucomicrobia bacterium]|nr:hypothetical protein [Verrucomicrobiota bacterium]